MKLLVYLACLIGSALARNMKDEHSTTSLVMANEIPTNVIKADAQASTTVFTAANRALKSNSQKGNKVSGKKKNHEKKNKKKNNGDEPPETSPDYWFDQKLDHLAANSPTWKQRYFLNDKFYGGKDSPVFALQVYGSLIIPQRMTLQDSTMTWQNRIKLWSWSWSTVT
jgi:hypothetical protein